MPPTGLTPRPLSPHAANNEVTFQVSSTKQKTYKVATGAVIFYNHRVADLGDLETGDDVEAEYILNSDEEIVALRAVKYVGAKLVDAYDARHDEIDFKVGASLDVDPDELEITVVRDGAAASLEDLAENDVLYYWYDDDASPEQVLIYAYSTKAEGTLESVSGSWTYVTVEGKGYYLTDPWYLSDDKGDTFAQKAAGASDWSGFLGTDVVAYLDHFGNVLAISGEPEEEEPEAIYAIAYDVKQVGGLEEVIYLRTFGADGKPHDYVVTKKTKINDTEVGATYTETRVEQLLTDNGAIPSLGPAGSGFYLVTVTLDSAGKLATVDTATSDDGTLTVSAKYDRVSFAGSTSAVTDKTVVFDLDAVFDGTPDIGDASVASWAALENATGTITGVVLADLGNALAIVVTDGTLRAEVTVGALESTYYTADGLNVKLNIKGESKAFTNETDKFTVSSLIYGNFGPAGGFSDLKKKEIVKITLDSAGKPVNAEELLAADTDPGAGEQRGPVEVKAVSASLYKIKIGDTYFFGDADTAVYDCTGSSPVAVDWSSIVAGDYVQLFDVNGDGIYDVIKIVPKP